MNVARLDEPGEHKVAEGVCREEISLSGWDWVGHTATVVISSLNEGPSLRANGAIVRGDHSHTRQFEILVADDHSEDNSVDEVRRLFPEVVVAAHDRRRGVSPTKDLGGRRASGDVLVFLDGHCKPEPGAIDGLIENVVRLDGRAIMTPAVCALDTATWQNQHHQVGHGYRLELLGFSCGWVGPDALRPRGEFYESPALIGCALAISRALYEELRWLRYRHERVGCRGSRFRIESVADGIDGPQRPARRLDRPPLPACV